MTVSDLQLAQNSHRYKHPHTGEVLVSVTNVCKSFDDGSKLMAGAYAAVKLAKEGLDFRTEWDAKADIGTAIHEHIGLWAEGKSTDVTEAEEPYLDAFTAFCDAKHPIWLQTDRAVASAWGYGGRLDLIGIIEEKGHPEIWLLDGKTGKYYARELELQLAGYASADGFIVYDQAGQAVDLEPIPTIDRWGGLYLHADGTAQLREVPQPLTGESLMHAQQEAIRAFRSLLNTRLWANSRPKQARGDR